MLVELTGIVLGLQPSFREYNTDRSLPVRIPEPTEPSREKPVQYALDRPGTRGLQNPNYFFSEKGEIFDLRPRSQTRGLKNGHNKPLKIPRAGYSGWRAQTIKS